MPSERGETWLCELFSWTSSCPKYVKNCLFTSMLSLKLLKFFTAVPQHYGSKVENLNSICADSFGLSLQCFRPQDLCSSQPRASEGLAQLLQTVAASREALTSFATRPRARSRRCDNFYNLNKQIETARSHSPEIGSLNINQH